MMITTSPPELPLTAMNTHYVSCTDAVGRVSQMTVQISGSRIAVLPPPGESALLTAASARRLADELTAFADKLTAHR